MEGRIDRPTPLGIVHRNYRSYGRLCPVCNHQLGGGVVVLKWRPTDNQNGYSPLLGK